MSAGIEWYLREILAELRISPKGETWPATILVPNTTVLTIDFADGTAKLARPDYKFDQNINIPQAYLFALIITNDGPNAVQYSTNRPISAQDADMPLKVGETQPL